MSRISFNDHPFTEILIESIAMSLKLILVLHSLIYHYLELVMVLEAWTLRISSLNITFSQIIEDFL